MKQDGAWLNGSRNKNNRCRRSAFGRGGGVAWVLKYSGMCLRLTINGFWMARALEVDGRNEEALILVAPSSLPRVTLGQRRGLSCGESFGCRWQPEFGFVEIVYRGYINGIGWRLFYSNIVFDEVLPYDIPYPTQNTALQIWMSFPFVSSCVDLFILSQVLYCFSVSIDPLLFCLHPFRFKYENRLPSLRLFVFSTQALYRMHQGKTSFRAKKEAAVTISRAWRNWQATSEASHWRTSSCMWPYSTRSLKRNVPPLPLP